MRTGLISILIMNVGDQWRPVADTLGDYSGKHTHKTIMNSLTRRREFVQVRAIHAIESVRVTNYML